MKISQQDMTVVFVAGRREKGSTECYLSFVGCTDPLLYLDLWASSGEHIGFIELRYVAEDSTNPRGTAGTYEVAGLLPAGFPCPGPVVSLSGVLWPRRAIPG